MLTAAARIIGLYLDLAIQTTRWRLVADEAARPLLKRGPAIVAFWHEHLARMPALCRRGPTRPPPPRRAAGGDEGAAPPRRGGRGLD